MNKKTYKAQPRLTYCFFSFVSSSFVVCLWNSTQQFQATMGAGHAAKVMLPICQSIRNKKSAGIRPPSAPNYSMSTYFNQPAVFVAPTQFTIFCDGTERYRFAEQFFSQNCISGCALSASGFPKKNNSKFLYCKTINRTRTKILKIMIVVGVRRLFSVGC